jgi:maltose alpha-D-glucosyltransferase/alpha-amylase
VEVFALQAFPAIGDLPYLLTMGPHGFYWFVLDDSPARHAQA